MLCLLVLDLVCQIQKFVVQLLMHMGVEKYLIKVKSLLVEFGQKLLAKSIRQHQFMLRMMMLKIMANVVIKLIKNYLKPLMVLNLSHSLLLRQFSLKVIKLVLHPPEVVVMLVKALVLVQILNPRLELKEKHMYLL